MLSSPLDASRIAEANDPESVFRQGLVEIDQLIDQGVSFSGHERNCAFLNVPGDAGAGRRFATASAALGLDADDDARSPALVDWDRDGDLDLWVTNRSAPMIRFLRNDSPPGDRWVSLRLQGQRSNRDAIGARLRLRLSDGRILSRTLKAGEGYLAQSSKWITVGLGAAADIDSVEIRWPGGAAETFRGVRPGGRFLLAEGSGAAHPDASAQPVLPPEAAPFQAPAESGAVQTLSVSGWPLPLLPYTTWQGEPQEAGGSSGSPLLLNLWATWCQPCFEELAQFGEQRADLARAGVRLLALSVDGLGLGDETGAKTADPAAVYDKLKLPFDGGRASAELVRRLENAYARLYGPRWPLPVPTSVLLDGQGRLLAFYKGTVAAERVIEDLRRSQLPPEARHDASLPFPGRWFFRPAPLQPMKLALDLMEDDQPEAAFDLARRARDRYREDPDYPKLLAWIGDGLMKRARPQDALQAYEEALAVDASNIIVLNNLAWQLAAHPDREVRDGAAAVQWAEKAAALTRSEDPSVLDTLAAAYAEAGRFPDAVRTAEKAADLAGKQKAGALREGIESRLRKYQARQKP